MSSITTPFEALLACLEKATSQSAFARDLAVSQPTVWRWLHRAKKMPAEYVLTAERLYGVSRHQLRPDIYPIDLPPFAPDAGTVTNTFGNGPCDRQMNLQRGEEEKAKPTSAPTTQRQEQQK